MTLKPARRTGEWISCRRELSAVLVESWAGRALGHSFAYSGPCRFLEARDEKGEPLDMEYIKAEILLVLLAGEFSRH